MKSLITVLFLLIANASAGDFDFEIPENDSHIKWDRSAIRLLGEVSAGKKKNYLLLKGTLVHVRPKSMTLQVNSEDAIRVGIKGMSFQKKVEISQFPAKVKIWLEHQDGKAVKVEEYLVNVHQKSASQNSKDHLINY